MSQLRNLCNYLPNCVWISILSILKPVWVLQVATALIQSRLDYSTSVLYGTSTSNLHKFQMVQNALARTIIHSPRSVPTSQLLSNLHWLPINKRTNFKVATLTYKVLSTQQPAYLRNLISYHQSKKLGPGPFCLTNFSARPVQGSTAYKHQSDWP